MKLTTTPAGHEVQKVSSVPTPLLISSWHAQTHILLHLDSLHCQPR